MKSMRIAACVVALVVTGFMAPAAYASTVVYAQDFDFPLATVGDGVNSLPNDPNGTFYRPIGPAPNDILISATTIGSGRSALAPGDGQEHTLAGFVFAAAYPSGSAALAPGHFMQLTATMQFTGTDAKGGIIIGQTQGGGPQYAAGWHIGFDMSGSNDSMRLTQRDPTAAQGPNPGDCGACLGTNLLSESVVEANLAGTPFEMRLDVFDNSSAQGFYRLTPGSGAWNEIGSGPLSMIGGLDIATNGVDYAMLTGMSTGSGVNIDDFRLTHMIPLPGAAWLGLSLLAGLGATRHILRRKG